MPPAAPPKLRPRPRATPAAPPKLRPRPRATPAAPPRLSLNSSAPRSRACATKHKVSMSEIIITNTCPEHIAQLVLHQQICFPTLAPEEWMRAEHFESHLRLF